MSTESVWDDAFRAAAACDALTEADIDALTDAIAALEVGPERDELMKAQLQSLASGRLGGMLASGQRVQISGLTSRPDLTGSTAKVLCFDSKRGRYAVEVQLDDRSESMFLKRSNLELVADLQTTAFMDAAQKQAAQQGGRAVGFMCEAGDQAGPAVQALTQAYAKWCDRELDGLRRDALEADPVSSRSRGLEAEA